MVQPGSIVDISAPLLEPDDADTNTPWSISSAPSSITPTDGCHLLAHRRRAGEDATARAYRWPIDHCATFEAEPAHVSPRARTWLVTDENAVDAESLPARAELGWAHHPSALGAADQLTHCGHGVRISWSAAASLEGFRSHVPVGAPIVRDSCCVPALRVQRVQGHVFGCNRYRSAVAREVRHSPRRLHVLPLPSVLNNHLRIGYSRDPARFHGPGDGSDQLRCRID